MASSKRPSTSTTEDDSVQLKEDISRLLRKYPHSRNCWIGLSGGCDSITLLHLCVSLRNTFPHLSFKAIHVNHDLHADASHWAAHCLEQCKSLSIPLVQIKVDANPKTGESPEEAARNARYSAFESVLVEDDLLLLAQHRDDQAETLLLQLLRGAGLEGLSAMAIEHRFCQSFILRPLLDRDAAELVCYAKKHGLAWIDDPSNKDDRYDRNFIRNQIIPLLQKRWPGASKTLARTARHAACSAKAQKERERALALALAPTDHLDLHACHNLSDYDFALALRGWFKSLRLRMPSEKTVEMIRKEFLLSRPDRMPELRIADGRYIYRHRQKAYLITLGATPAPTEWNQWPKPIELPPTNGILEAVVCNLDLVKEAPLTIRYRSGGEKVRIKGRGGHHDLGTLLHEAGIPHWVRRRIPLVYSGEKLIAIPGLRIQIDADAEPLESVLRWRFPEALDPTGALQRWLKRDT